MTRRRAYLASVLSGVCDWAVLFSGGHESLWAYIMVGVITGIGWGFV
jgi:hypothetical protein